MASILVIDDEVLMRTTLRTALEKAGHQVAEARDGNQGMKVFAEVRPDLVLTDIIMPDREGIEMIREMRSLDPDVPIIAMSGGGSVGGDLFLELAARLGATRTLSKPIRNADLVAAVDECLQQSGGRLQA
jgi:DNA-binding NtrC family response regulator